MRVLITGGAGFIGSHLADAPLAAGHTVRALDNLDPQVHAGGKRPDYLHPEVELRVGDVRDHDAVAGALEGVDTVVHFAAAVGVGQSMYDIERYTSVNAIGAAVVLEEIAKVRDRLQRVLVASSMSIYGEGRYRCPEHGLVAPQGRSDEQLHRRAGGPGGGEARGRRPAGGGIFAGSGGGGSWSLFPRGRKSRSGRCRSTP